MAKIHVSAGTDDRSHRYVLLHELAHYILHRSRKGRGECHSLRFWRLAFELYGKYGVDVEYAYSKEKHYRAKAKWAYDELKEKSPA
jgi:predicted metal-dependent hydrolase